MKSASENMDPVKVSIVLPTYNQSKYLASAIQTIVNQTFQDYELIIVNDGSTDETEKLLSTLSHPKIRVVNQANQKLPAALNAGFAHARGEYWTWTSTDNVVAPTWLEELIKALDNSPPEVGYAFSAYAIINENSQVTCFNRSLRFDLPSLFFRNSGNASFLYRASLAKQVGEYDTSLVYAEDLDMWVRMAPLTRAVYVETVLYYYRQHNESMTIQQDKVKLASQGVINKYLQKTNGTFDIDQLFPHIYLSANPPLERWKSRVWLASLAMQSHFGCPVKVIVEQLIKALHEYDEPGLVGNMVHILAKEDQWDVAEKIVSTYHQAKPNDLLTRLLMIIQAKDKQALQQIPFITVEEKLLAAECNSSYTQKELMHNFVFSSRMQTKEVSNPLENIVIQLSNELEDKQHHPEIWQKLASLNTPEDMTLLKQLKLYLNALVNLPQNPDAQLVLSTLEAMCSAYTDSYEVAKNKLIQLLTQYSTLPLLTGALHFIAQEKVSSTTLANVEMP